MKVKVNYAKIVFAQAMSKSPNQKGIILSDDGNPIDVVSLHCINAKDGKQTSHLRLQIPKDNIEQFIEALKEFV